MAAAGVWMEGLRLVRFETAMRQDGHGVAKRAKELICEPELRQHRNSSALTRVLNAPILKC